MQQLRAAKIHKKARREEEISELVAQADSGSESEELPVELLARVDESEEEAWFPGQDNTSREDLSDMDVEEENVLSVSDSEEEIIDDEGRVELDTSAFEMLFAGAKKYDAFQHTSFIYQRGPELFGQCSGSAQENENKLQLQKTLILLRPIFNDLKTDKPILSALRDLRPHGIKCRSINDYLLLASWRRNYRRSKG